MPRATSSATAPSRTPASSSPQRHCAVCLAGNHDLGVIGVPVARGLQPRRADRRRVDARRTISEDTREFLLALTPERRGARLRALPRVPARPDLGVRPLRPDRRAVLRRHGLPGHPSSATRTWRCPSTARRASRRPARPAARATSSTSPTGDWLLNPGGAGQPRDGDPRAAWLLLDTETNVARWQRAGIRHCRCTGGDSGRPAARLAGRATRVRTVTSGAGWGS